MTWNTVQKLVEGTGVHSTLIGKFWNTLFFVIRFLLVVSIASKITYSYFLKCDLCFEQYTVPCF